MTFQITDLIDFSRLQKLLIQHHDSVGVDSAITLPDGSFIVKPDTFLSFLLNDIRKEEHKLVGYLFPKLKAFGENGVGELMLCCCFDDGLYRAVIPICFQGVHLANWIMGPAKDEKFDVEAFMQNHHVEGKEKAQFINEKANFPFMTKEHFEGIAKSGHIFIQQVIEESHTKYQLQSKVEAYKERELELLQDKKLLKSIMDIMPDHIYFKDRDSRFIASNKAQLKMFGLSDAKQIIGKTDFDFFSSQHAQEAYNDEQKIIQDDIIIEKEENETWKDKPDSWVSTIKAPLKDESGTIIGTFGISRNISLRKSFESKLLNDERIIQEQNNELKQMNAQKDKFFSIMAHDLRSPFNAFLGMTELLEKQQDTMTREEIKTIAGDMKNSATRIYNLLSNLLEWSRLQRGLVKPAIQNFLLNDVVQQSVEALEDNAFNKEIQISNCIPGDLEINADPFMLQIIVQNLLSNSIKFTPVNGKVELNAQKYNKQDVEITITDTGIGMGPEMIANLFRVDVKTNRNGTDGEPSTGLGLILCKEFIEQHGGRLEVKSKKGKGSTFSFTIPHSA